MTTDFLNMDDLSVDELEKVLDITSNLKNKHALGIDEEVLPNKTLCMIFEKPSTRTRLSFETGMTQLGGHGIFLSSQDIHLGHGEPIKDTARATSEYADFIMARLYDHSVLSEFAKYATVPVINGLTDRSHPCQTLADLVTIREHFGSLDVDVAWVGDGNNVCQSLIIGASMTDIDLTVATPEGYQPDEDVLERAKKLDSKPRVTTDAKKAVEDADLIYTDVWTSMGQENEREKRLADFKELQVDTELVGDRQVMHCLPAHRGEEITEEVLESDLSLVWDQAENRLHAQKGLLVWLDRHRKPSSQKRLGYTQK